MADPTGVVRISDAMLAEVKHVAGLKGMTAGDVIAEAWNQWVDRNRESIAAELEEYAAKLRRPSDGTS